MTRTATFKLHSYLALVAILVVAAFALRRPELVVVAAPFALLLALGLARGGGVPRVSLHMDCPREQALEGERLALRLKIRADRDVQLLDIAVTLPPGLEPATRRLTIANLQAGEWRTVDMPVQVGHWGVYASARCALRARSALGIFQDEALVDDALRVAGLPAQRDVAGHDRAARDAAVRRQSGGAQHGKRHRVRRDPPLPGR